jgi:hypothetical protein
MRVFATGVANRFECGAFTEVAAALVVFAPAVAADLRVSRVVVGLARRGLAPPAARAIVPPVGATRASACSKNQVYMRRSNVGAAGCRIAFAGLADSRS